MVRAQVSIFAVCMKIDIINPRIDLQETVACANGTVATDNFDIWMAEGWRADSKLHRSTVTIAVVRGDFCRVWRSSHDGL